MTKTQENVEELEQYALDNYEAGGHWVYETYSRAEYVDALECSAYDLDAAKKRIREHWELLVMQERDCSWGE